MLNKKIIIAIVIFIVGGLLIYSFANPLDDSGRDLSDGIVTPGQSEQNSSKKDKDTSKDSEDSEKKDSDDAELTGEGTEGEQTSGEQNSNSNEGSSSWIPVKFPSISAPNNNRTPLESGTSTGGNNQGSSTGGNNQGSSTGGNNQGSSTGGNNQGSSTGGDNQGSSTGGNNQGSSTGGDNQGSSTGGNNQGSSTGGDNQTPTQPEQPEQPVVEPIGVAAVTVDVETETATTKTNISSNQSDKVITLSGVIEQKVSSVYTYNLEVRLTAPKILDQSVLQNFKYNVLENDYGISPKVFSGINILSNSDRINSEAAYFVVNLPFQEDITAADATPLEISVDWGDGNPIIYSFDFRGISIKKN